MSDDEIPLHGGRVTRGVVRIGDTARRPRTANSVFVAQLLRHLAAKGFGAAPAYLGMDEHHRDMLGFIEGDVPAELGFYSDGTLGRAARLIRRYHDLSAELIDAPAAGIEIVCHNDLSPCNFVFRNAVPVAIIDFDAAAPGSRAHDLGYAAWLWLDIGEPEIRPMEQGRRLASFLAAYGTDDRSGVVAAMLKRQAALAEEGCRLSNDAMTKWALDCLDWTRRNETLLVG